MACPVLANQHSHGRIYEIPVNLLLFVNFALEGRSVQLRLLGRGQLQCAQEGGPEVPLGEDKQLLGLLPGRNVPWPVSQLQVKSTEGLQIEYSRHDKMV
jgi:hypothetical protein